MNLKKISENMQMLIYIDMDDVLCDFSKAKKIALKEFPEIVYPNSRYGFYRNLEPMLGAVEAINELVNNPAFDVYILTAPSIYNPFSYTEKRVWVEQHLGFEMVKKLIISSDKGLLRGEILIDDKISGHGQEGFKGRLIQFGSDQFPDWQAVLAELADVSKRKG